MFSRRSDVSAQRLKRIFAMLALCMLVLLVFVQVAVADTDGTYDYTITDGKATITAYICTLMLRFLQRSGVPP